MPDAPWNLFVQPDQRSCGATVLVVAKLLADPQYAAYVEGADGLAARFRAEALAMHQRVTGLADTSGRPQLPWPRAFGTPPWAVARQLGATPAADGSHATYSWRLVRTSQSASYDRLLAAARTGRVSAVYLGSTWIPRHVVLVVDATPQGTLHVYDPAAGRLTELARAAYAGNHVGIAGWDVVWFDVTPSAP